LNDLAKMNGAGTRVFFLFLILMEQRLGGIKNGPEIKID